MKLFSVKETEELKIDEIHGLYKKFVNSGQVELISKFGFGNDLIERSEENFIYTKSGKKIYDFTGGIGVLNHGHNNKRILKVRENYAKEKKMEVHKNFFSPYVAALSHNIANLLPEDLNITYLSNSGSDANEGALKLAYKYHGGNREYVLNSNISFHGKKIITSNVTSSQETNYFQFQQHIKNAEFEYNNILSVINLVKKIRKNGKSNIYAIIIEPFSASTLLNCSKDFLFELRKICIKEDIVLIFDEVYSGWSKTGKLFYFMNFDKLVPDIVTSGKSLGGGKASISAYTCKDKFFSKAYGNLRDATLHSSTFNALGEETITALEAVNIIIDENYEEKSKNIFNIINPELKKLMIKYPSIIKSVRGAGALNGVVINTDFADKYLQPIISLIPSKFTNDKYALKKILVTSLISALYDDFNILTFYGSNVDLPLKISAPVITKKEDLLYFIDSFDKVLAEGMFHNVKKFVKKNIFK
jgi:putrescine aminotransferase